MNEQNRYQQNQNIYIYNSEYGFDLEGGFKVKVNQVVDEQAKGDDYTHKVLLHVQPKQAEIIQYLKDRQAQTWHLDPPIPYLPPSLGMEQVASAP